MKNIRLTTAIALTIAIASPATFALDDKEKRELKGAAFFSGSAAVGALVGGPVGMVIGGISGAIFDDQQNKKADALKANEEKEMEITRLENHIDQQQMTLISLENKVAKKLEFQVMFPTGVDALSFEDKQRIESLSDYLKENTHLQVRLDGHADPRGTDEYNNVLSSERAKSVAAILEESGIEKQRINIYAHGASKAPQVKDADSFAFARRVNIEVFAQDATTQVSQTSLTAQ